MRASRHSAAGHSMTNHQRPSSTRPPILVLAILDGWGLSELREGNAVAQARTPTLEMLYSRCPWVSLSASGFRVGLPEGQMGNSETGHFNLGAGRIVYQDISRINDSIQWGDFFENQEILPILEKARSRALHILGLVSDGGVHSHIRHLFAILSFAKEQGVEKVFIHTFTDGRDTAPRSGMNFLRQVQAETHRLGVGKVASVSGRYYAMDRDNRWERTEKAYRAIVEQKPARVFKDPLEGVETSYRDGVSDEFIVPFTVVDENGQVSGRLNEEDAVIFSNFRSDRARQLTRALALEDFPHFPRPQGPVRAFLTMTEYDHTFPFPFAFPPMPLDRTLVKLFTHHNLRNLRLAETEKYAHVTYFFNGGEEQLFPCEDRVLIPSPRVATYDMKPEMSAFEITDRLLHELDRQCFDTVVVNFANADMVGHTGFMQAAVKAVEAVDTCVGRIYRKVRDLGGLLVVTADHGNAEQMINPESGEVHKAHTANPVPFVLADSHCKGKLRSGGALEDVAPTLLEYLQIEKPAEMTGHSLLRNDE